MFKFKRDLDTRFLVAGFHLLVGVFLLFLYVKFDSTFAAVMFILFVGFVLGQLDSIIRELRGK